MKSKVVVLSCDSYKEDLVYDKISKGLELLGGLEQFIGKEEKILLKPNLVRKAEVERAVITHPSIVAAMARYLREHNYKNISCGDSCGIGLANKVMEGTGMDAALEKYQIPVVDFNEGSIVAYPKGKIAKEFYLAKPVQECEALINLCKMKTHALERVTGGIKNLYGCISGLHKAQGHTKYSNADSFARMLIDLNQIVNPRLCIMDGVVAMDGNGPTSGDPISMNVILMSTDPVALDTVFCHLVHLKPDMVPTNVHGERMGLGTWKEEEIQILSEDGELSVKELQDCFGNPNYNVDRKVYRNTKWNKLDALLKPFQKKPYVVETDCRKCGICVEACPVEGKAIAFSNGRKQPPVYDYKKCIRCFCCQEMCPHKAIKVK